MICTFFITCVFEEKPSNLLDLTFLQHASEPDPASDHASEPQPASDHASEPQPASGHASEPEPASDHASEPQPASGHASEPDPASDHAAEPEPASGHASEASGRLKRVLLSLSLSRFENEEIVFGVITACSGHVACSPGY
ncbi:hypothetical protein LDENG_00271580 [Lucifuga dentata]|nr:hypothetical protein LDENG_00271580 [Lucifuga dentata]